MIIVVTRQRQPHVLMDGVMTRHEMRPAQRPGPVDAHRHRRGPDRGDGPRRLQRLRRIPAMPAEARVALILAKYAVFGDRAAGHPERSRSTCRSRPSASRRSRAPTSPTSSSSRRKSGYVFYIEPGPVPGTNIAYWGPEIKVGVAAAGAERQHGRAHQRRVAELQLRRRQKTDVADRLRSRTS